MCIDKFDFDGLMRFLEEKVNKAPASQEYRELVQKLVEYGTANRRTTKDDLCYFLSDTIPGLTFEDAIVFESDEYLTVSAIYQKREKTLSFAIPYQEVVHTTSELLIAKGFCDCSENVYKVLSHFSTSGMMETFLHDLKASLDRAISVTDDEDGGGQLWRVD